MSEDELNQARVLTDSRKIRKLSGINTWISLSQILIEYIGIGLSIYLGITFWSIPLYLLVCLYIASRKHGLGIIMHDGIHYKIAKNKRVNDFITDLLICFPLFASLHNGRRTHFLHHQNANTDDDPDWIVKKGPEWKFPQSKLRFMWYIFKYSLGIHVFLNFLSKKSLKQKFLYAYRSITVNSVVDDNTKQLTFVTYPYFKAVRISYYLIALLSILYFNVGVYFLLFWIMPSFLWMPFISKIRTVSEHFGLEEQPDKNFSLTRTTYPTFIDKYLLSANWNGTYHLDHHLYPSVPSYRLKRLHKYLRNTSTYNKYAHITHSGYLGVFFECTN